MSDAESKDADEALKLLFHVNDMPDAVKKNVLDEEGKLSGFSKKFVLFLTAIQKVFYHHFFKKVGECSPEDVWDTLKSPKPFVNEVCKSFAEEYKTRILDCIPKESESALKSFLPEGLMPLVHKKYVLVCMLTLPAAITSLNPDERTVYYRMLSGDTMADAEMAEEKLFELMENFQKELDKIHNGIQDEWQDRTLDAYNKKLLSKELMEFIMAEANRRKVKEDR